MCAQAHQFKLKCQSGDVESEPIEPTRPGLRFKARQDESFPISVSSQPPLPRDSLTTGVAPLPPIGCRNVQVSAEAEPASSIRAEAATEAPQRENGANIRAMDWLRERSKQKCKPHPRGKPATQEKSIASTAKEQANCRPDGSARPPPARAIPAAHTARLSRRSEEKLQTNLNAVLIATEAVIWLFAIVIVNPKITPGQI